MSLTKHLSLLAGSLLVAACSGGGNKGPEQFQVSTQPGAGGKLSPTVLTAAAGSTVSLTVTPDTGYEIASVSGCGGSLNGTTFTTAALSSSCTVSASFALKKYAVTVTVTGGGSASPSSVNVEHGKTTSVALSPQAGFETGTVSGCGGSLSGSSYTTGAVTAACTVSVEFTAKKSLVGVAAAGAPINGRVFALDGKGVMRQAAITNGTGRYQLDIAGMTAPILLNARGNIGQATVSYYSVAQQADFGGHINITPLSDLIIANAIGGATAGFLDKPAFSKLQATGVEAAKTNLTQRIQPLLTGFAVAADFDLLRTPFQAHHKGFDALMDVLSVSTNTETNVATLSYKLGNESITDDLKSSSDTQVMSAPTNLSQAQADLDAAIARWQAFADLFKTALPNANDAAFRALFHTSYRDGADTDPASILGSHLVGFTVHELTLVRKISDSEWVMGARLDDKSGQTLDRIEWVMVKDGGLWKFAGSQNRVAFKWHPQVWALSSGGYDSHIEIDFDGGDPSVKYVKVSGPGLDSSTPFGKGILFTSSGIYQSSLNAWWVQECGVATTACFSRANLKAGRHYSVQGYGANFAPIGGAQSLYLDAVPMSAADAAAQATSLFPKFTKVTKADGTEIKTLADAAKGGAFTVHWTLPTRSAPACINNLGFAVFGSAGRLAVNNESLACGATSGSLTVSAYSGTASLAETWLWIDHESGTSFGLPYQFK